MGFGPAEAERMRARAGLFEELEDLTDRLAAPAYATLDPADQERLAELLGPIADAAWGDIPSPNAMGLPAR
jgi:hypothetical protein